MAIRVRHYQDAVNNSTRKINWIVVGVGDVAVRRVIPAILREPRSRLYGAVSGNPTHARTFVDNIWPELEHALADPIIDAVYVATPVFLHCRQTVRSLRSGKPVLCEKPMALNSAEAQLMVQAAQQSRCLLGTAYFRRAYPKLQRARELLTRGVIGTPVLAEIKCHEAVQPGGEERKWLFDPELAGAGPLYDIGSHRIDTLVYLFGKPTRVNSQLSNATYHLRVEDAATVLVEFERGVRGVVDVRWNTQRPCDDFKIFGSKGLMDLSPLNGPELAYGDVREDLPCDSNRHYPCIENFADAILNGSPLLSDGACASITDRILESAKTEGTLKV